MGVLFLYVTTQKWQQIIRLCEIFIDESLFSLTLNTLSVLLALVATYFQLTSNAASLLRRTSCLCLKVETDNVVSCKKLIKLQVREKKQQIKNVVVSVLIIELKYLI